MFEVTFTLFWWISICFSFSMDFLIFFSFHCSGEINPQIRWSKFQISGRKLNHNLVPSMSPPVSSPLLFSYALLPLPHIPSPFLSLSFVWVFLAWKIPYPACILDLCYLDIKNVSLLSVVDCLNILLYFIFYDVLSIKIFHIINFINLFHLCLWTLCKVKMPHILFHGSCVCVCTPIVLLLLLFHI